jgi:membrane protein DedA with SNARE-associated domain
MNISTGLHQLLTTIYQISQNPAIGVWKYLLLGLLVGVEGPIMTLIGAAAAAGGYMKPDLVFISASIGNLSADTIWYSVGYAGKIEWLMRVGRKIGLKKQDVQRLKVRMRQHAPKILLIAKITSGLIIPSLVAAGLARVPWKRWFPPVALGEVFWTGSLVLIGYYAAHSIAQIQSDIHVFVTVATVLLGLGLVWLIRRSLKKKGSDMDNLFQDD